MRWIVDGRCVIDVVMAPESTVTKDLSPGRDIGVAIAALLANCVYKPPSRSGGVASGAGKLLFRFLPKPFPFILSYSLRQT